MFWSWQISKCLVYINRKSFTLTPSRERSFRETEVPISAQKPISRGSHWSVVELLELCKTCMETSLQVLSIRFDFSSLFRGLVFTVFSSYMGEIWLLHFVILSKLLDGMDFWLHRQRHPLNSRSRVLFFSFNWPANNSDQNHLREFYSFTNSLVSLEKKWKFTNNLLFLLIHFSCLGNCLSFKMIMILNVVLIKQNLSRRGRGFWQNTAVLKRDRNSCSLWSHQSWLSDIYLFFPPNISI